MLYRSLHTWIREKRGKPIKCEHCDTTKGRLEWANKSGKYNKVLDDWISLCVFCHRRYDKKSYEENNQRRKTGKYKLCMVCNKQFYSKLCLVKRTRYCSQECRLKVFRFIRLKTI